MRPRRCTIDSSCLIALDHLGLIPQLSVLFSIVLVPKAVRMELFRRPSTKRRLQAVFRDFAFFQRCDGYEQGTVDFLLAEKKREGREDRGEVEAVVQATQFGASVIVDDAEGRELAARNRLEFHGSLWVLQRFHAVGLLSETTVRSCFVSLREHQRWLPWKEVNEFLVKIGQPAL